MVRLLSSVVALSTLALWATGCSEPEPAPTEILWDDWGVPHLYSNDESELFRAFGWAQMHSHGDLILKLYGQARGRAAEYWGEDYLESDRWVKTMGIAGRAEQWVAAQSPEFRLHLDAFADGMNAYAEQHGDLLAADRRVVLPITAVDVVAHTQRVIHFSFVANPRTVERSRFLVNKTGSNAWAIGPSRSASGHAMLLANPHLSWSDLHMFYEAHLVGPGIDFYGATLVGFPVLVLGFNDRLGWTHTVNTLDGADLYDLTLKDDGYLWESVVHAFDTTASTLKIKEPEGGLREVPLSIRHSIHGPVILQKDNRAVALRVAALDQPGMLEQWWDMARARDLAELETALRRLQIPMFNVLYADADGHILYLFNGRVPIKPQGDFEFWQRNLAPGDTAASLWSQTHDYDDLPRILDPQSGWLQNANDPPWTATYPPALDPADFPAYLSPRFMHFRAQHSASLLANDDQVTFQELLDYKHSTHVPLAARILDDLSSAVRQFGDEKSRTAMKVLDTWDRKVDSDSRGAVLFIRWVREMRGMQDDSFQVPWHPESPYSTPDGLTDPAAAVTALNRAAASVLKAHGNLAVAWGDVYRIRYAGKDLPANGGPGNPLGIFRSLYFKPAQDNISVAESGDTFYAAIEFADPVRARVLLSYGNASQASSAHRGDQLELFARKELRTPWRTREQIEAHLEAHTVSDTVFRHCLPILERRLLPSCGTTYGMRCARCSKTGFSPYRRSCRSLSASGPTSRSLLSSKRSSSIRCRSSSPPSSSRCSLATWRIPHRSRFPTPTISITGNKAARSSGIWPPRGGTASLSPRAKERSVSSARSSLQTILICWASRPQPVAPFSPRRVRLPAPIRSSY